MTPHDCQQYAKLLTTYCLELKKNQKVLIRSTYLAEPLLQALQTEILQIGALLETQITFKNQTKNYYTNTQNDNLKIEPTFYKLALETFDAIITIDASPAALPSKNRPAVDSRQGRQIRCSTMPSIVATSNNALLLMVAALALSTASAPPLPGSCVVALSASFPR